MKTTKYETPVSLTFSNSLCNMHFHWTHKHNMEAGGWGGVGVNDYLALYMHAVRTCVYRCGRGLVGVMDMSKAAGAGY